MLCLLRTMERELTLPSAKHQGWDGVIRIETKLGRELHRRMEQIWRETLIPLARGTSPLIIFKVPPPCPAHCSSSPLPPLPLPRPCHHDLPSHLSTPRGRSWTHLSPRNPWQMNLPSNPSGGCPPLTLDSSHWHRNF
jgi:hypothetical protein